MKKESEQKWIICVKKQKSDFVKLITDYSPKKERRNFISELFKNIKNLYNSLLHRKKFNRNVDKMSYLT